MSNPDLAQNFSGVYSALTEWVINNYSPISFKEKKDIYFKEQGKVFEDDINFEARMTLFMDLFIFYYANFMEKTPFENACGKSKKNEFYQIKRAIYSCFQVKKITKKIYVIKDLIFYNNYSLCQKSFRGFASSFDRKQIFQGFIFEYNGLYYPSQGLIFHAIEAENYIEKTIKFYKKQNNFDKFYLLNTLAQIDARVTRNFNLQALKLYQPNFHSNFRIFYL